jgi:peptidoglycan/LPS O-acetylase OafA/YrhL
MDFLLITRGLLAISVVMWHFSGYQSKFYPLLNLPGRTAVWLFFGISGYVIAYGFIHKRYKLTLSDLKDFYTNRLLRIYPLFFFISVITLITQFILSGELPIGIKDIASQFLFIQFNHSYTLSGVFWTLGIELQFYLIAPFIAYLLFLNLHNKMYFLPPLLYLISISIIYYATHVMNWSFDSRNIIGNLPHFISGMLACYFVSKISPTRKKMFYSVIFALILLGYTNWIYQYNSGKYWSIKGILLVDMIIFLLVYAHANTKSIHFRFRSIEYFFSMIGILSYGIYAWHSYLIKYVPLISFDLLRLTIATVVFAFFSYRLIELPALKIKLKKHASIKNDY